MTTAFCCWCIQGLRVTKGNSHPTQERNARLLHDRQYTLTLIYRVSHGEISFVSIESNPAENNRARWPGLDKLRATCMFGIVLYHSVLSLTYFEGWPVVDLARSQAFEIARWLVVGSFLRVFFVLSGFFS